MDSLDMLRTFSEVASTGSFSRTAKNLGMSTATVSKYVASLEGRFGVRLLNRSTRSVSLTDAGMILLERSGPILELTQAAQKELESRAVIPRGRLRVSAPHGIDLTNLPEMIVDFLAQHKEVSISLELTNRVVDLTEDGIDIALRFGPTANENLIIRKLVPMELSVCAAPGYWRRYGKPEIPEQLIRFNALINNLHVSPRWQFSVNGSLLEVPVRGQLRATESGSLLQAALLGAGVIYLPSVILAPYVQSGRLEPVLKEFMRNDMWLSAVYLERRHTSALHRAFLEFLQQRFSQKTNVSTMQ